MAKEDVVLITGTSGFIGGAITRKLGSEYTLVGSTGLAHRIPLRRHTLSTLT